MNVFVRTYVSHQQCKHKYLIKIHKFILLSSPTLHHFQYISELHFMLGDNIPALVYKPLHGCASLLLTKLLVYRGFVMEFKTKTYNIFYSSNQ